MVERLKAAGLSGRIHRGNVLNGDMAWCVKGRLREVAFDILPPVVPFDFDLAVRVGLARGTVRVVDLDGLLRLKLRAGGPQGLLDTAQLLRKHPEMLERVRPIAEAYSQWEQLESWLDDPRLR